MPRIDILNGNQAAAVGAKLSRPDVIAAYPITPQTPIVEYLTQFAADGDLDSAMSEVESEHSAMSVLTGASMAGARTFTATSSQGLALMYEPYFRASTLRLPVVMAIVNREMISPQTVWGAPQDSLSLRDSGWIQIYVEDNQEILDMIVQAYRVAEDKRVLLPVNVCYDGFYLSHMTERVEVPDQEEIDRYLPAYRPTHVILDPERPMSVDPLTPGDLLTGYRQNHLRAMVNALEVIEEADQAYAAVTGRSWGGLVENYHCDDAQTVVVTLGSMTGAAKTAVDSMRERGYKAGVLKIRSLRPFPQQAVIQALQGRRAFAVVDRNVCFGRNTGIIYQEVRSALCGLRKPVPSIDFIGGLGGEDLTVSHFERVIEILDLVADGRAQEEAALWLERNQVWGGAIDERYRKIS